jgi:hypothetical protein
MFWSSVFSVKNITPKQHVLFSGFSGSKGIACMYMFCFSGFSGSKGIACMYMFCSLASLAQRVLPVCTCSVSLASLAQTKTSLAHVLSFWLKIERPHTDVLVFWPLWLKIHRITPNILSLWFFCSKIWKTKLTCSVSLASPSQEGDKYPKIFYFLTVCHKSTAQSSMFCSLPPQLKFWKALYSLWLQKVPLSVTKFWRGKSCSVSLASSS